MRILVVCTANICRSASAEVLLRDAVDAHSGLAGVEVRSAGTHAVVGAPGCRIAPALEGRAEEHRSQPLTPELVEWADLILAAAREHRAAVVAMDARARPKVFTVRQAGRIADWLVLRGAGQVPVDPRAVVEELDAARGLAPIAGDGNREGDGTGEPSRAAWRALLRRGSATSAADQAEDSHQDDIADPHVHGAGFHAQGAAQLEESIGALISYLVRVSAT